MHIIFVILAITLRIFSNSFSNVFQKQLAEHKEKPAVINFFNYFILSLFSVFIIFLSDFSYLNFEFIIYAVLGGIFGAICNCFMVLALEKGQLSVLGPLNSYKAVIGLIFGIIILGEYPDIYGLLGIILIIMGSYFIFDSPKDILKKDIGYRFCALFFSAVEAVFIKKVIVLSSITISFAVSSIMGCLFSYLITRYITKSQIKIPAKNICPKYIFASLCFGIMTFSTAYVFKYLNVGYALSLFQLSIILNVFLGWKLFKEQNLHKKLAGSAIIILGSVIILLT